MWYETWFNDDYLAAYPHRNRLEAEGQIAALISLLDLTPDQRTLDLACGAGRHTLALARRGFLVTGLDLSATLLNQAKKSALEENLHPQWIHRDMRSLENLGPFDLIINLFTSFGYFPDPRDNFKVLTQAHAILQPGGKLVIDTLHPHQAEDLPTDPIKQKIGHDLVTITYERRGDTVEKKLVFPHQTYYERVTLYSRNQLIALASQAGFHTPRVYGNLLGDPWTDQGERQVLVASK